MAYTVVLTERELVALSMCISGELENDDPHQDKQGYMNPLRRVIRKLERAREDA